MVRLVPQPGEPTDADELNDVNGLIQARIDGRLSRRALVERALKIGIAAPVVGVMLHATSDMAFGAPSNGREATLARLQQGQTVPVTGPTKPAGTQQEVGTIVVGCQQEPDFIHPYLSQTVTGTDVAVGVCQRLMEYDGNQQLFGVLATEYSISDDGLTYTFKLRPGITFHSGDPLTGQDVIDSWKMIMNPDFGAFSKLGWEKITDITLADNGMTVVMATSEVYAPFISYVGAGNNAILPSKELAKGVDNFKQKFGREYMIGTGPFKFVEWKAKEQITLERNDAYWGGKPHLEKIIYRIVPDTNTLLVQLQTGEVNLVGSAGALGALDVEKALGYDNVIVLEHPTQGWDHLDLKHIDFLRMTKVRQALDYATPKQQIIEQLLKNRAVPSIGDQAPGSWAFNPDIQPRPYDPDKAKQLLTEAGLTEQDGGWSGPTPAGTPRQSGGDFPADQGDPNVVPATGPVKKFEMELWGLAGDEQNNRICQVIAQAWNQIGIKTEAKFEDTSTIWGPNGYQFTDKMTASLWAWYNGNDPDDQFYWNSSQIPTTPTGTGGNLPAYFFKYNFQQKIDDLTSSAAKETDQEKRKQLYFQIQQLLFDEEPVVWIYWGKAFPVVDPNIGGFWPSAFNNLLWNAEQWYLTQQ
ncbi:MAG TPA: ABC transporter substrate-binding protein [Thermomicrobiales bacterium]|jgi:peptide/nickel transport system substrate-binding protein